MENKTPETFASGLQKKLEDKVIRTTDAPIQMVLLWGYLFEYPNEYHLYLNLQFDEYLIITRDTGTAGEADYIYDQPLATESSPLAGSLVWVRADARLRYIRTGIPATQAANMLAGAIQQQLSQGGGSPMPLMSLGRSSGISPMDPGSYGGCGTGNNTPGCPYAPDTSLVQCPPGS